MSRDFARACRETALADSLRGRSLPPGVLDRLSTFARLLLRWNQRINLIGRDTEPVLWERHILDAAQLVPLLPDALGRGIDIGTGGGFPGLILALLADVPFDLIEADQRKAAFLREAARITAAPVTVHAVPASAAVVDRSPLITARACAPLPRLLKLAVPLLAPGGICLFLKGAGVESELTAARREWHMRIDRIPSRTAADAQILRLHEIERVGAPD